MIARGCDDPDVPGGPQRSTRLCRISNRGEQDTALGNKIYVGNIPFSATEDELRDLFARHGNVQSVNVIMDRETGRPRGFAFVEMEEASSAQDAISALDGSDLGGRNLRVNEAQERR